MADPKYIIDCKGANNEVATYCEVYEGTVIFRQFNENVCDIIQFDLLALLGLAQQLERKEILCEECGGVKHD